MHEALETYRGQLPALDAAGDSLRLLAHPLTRRALDRRDRAMLVAAAHRLAERTPVLDAQPVHGDAHLGNLFAGNVVRWADFDLVCRAPREWDLACALSMERTLARPASPAEALLEGYGWTDVEALAPWIELRALFHTAFNAFAVLRAPHRPELKDTLARRLAWWRSRASD